MKHYTIDGITYDELPDPCKGVSPMTEARFVALGGTITDDGEPSPKQRVCAELNAALAELAEEVPNVTIAEFKQAAASLYSAGLISWAKSKDVPDAVIDAARARIVEIMADAFRIGMTWNELIAGIEA